MDSSGVKCSGSRVASQSSFKSPSMVDVAGDSCENIPRFAAYCAGGQMPRSRRHQPASCAHDAQQYAPRSLRAATLLHFIPVVGASSSGGCSSMDWGSLPVYWPSPILLSSVCGSRQKSLFPQSKWPPQFSREAACQHQANSPRHNGAERFQYNKFCGSPSHKLGK